MIRTNFKKTISTFFIINLIFLTGPYPVLAAKTTEPPKSEIKVESKKEIIQNETEPQSAKSKQQKNQADQSETGPNEQNAPESNDETENSNTNHSRQNPDQSSANDEETKNNPDSDQKKDPEQETRQNLTVEPTQTESNQSDESLKDSQTLASTPTATPSPKADSKPTDIKASPSPTATPTVTPTATKPSPTISQIAQAEPTISISLASTISPTPPESQTKLTPSPTPTMSTPTPSPTVDPCIPLDDSVLVDQTNQACLDQNFTASSSTGLNQQISDGSTEMETGDAQVLLDFINALNLESNSSVYLVSFDQLDSSSQELDLNQLWTEMDQLFNSSHRDQSTLVDNNFIEYLNIARISTNINLSANTGQNSVENNGDSLNLTTGDAQIVVNGVNFANVNFKDSIFLFSSINITDDYNGNIILPRPEKIGQFYLLEPFNQVDQTLVETNQAEISTQLVASSNTGHNQTKNENGQSSLETGQATTVINTTDSVNSSYYDHNLYYLLLNILGSWTGSILHADIDQALDTKTEPLMSSDQTNSHSFQSSYNYGQVKTKANLSANTGYNQTQTSGDSQIKTGDAIIAFNLFNFINDSFYQSRWFLSTVNVLKDWTGNLIFAYPDLDLAGSVATSDNNPRVLSLKLDLKNTGRDTAHNSSLNLTLPAELSVVSATNNGQISESSVSWDMSTVDSQENKSVNLTLQLNNPEQITQKTKLIVQAQADTSDPEPNYHNNSYQLTVVIDPTNLTNETKVSENPAQTQLVASEPTEQSQKETGLPYLTLTASNNAGSFVNQGDTLIFDLVIKNEGNVGSKNGFIAHRIFTPDGSPAGTLQFFVGDLTIGKELVVTFEFRLDDKIVLPAGTYATETTAYGFAENGKLVMSNTATTKFNLAKLASVDNWLSIAQADINQPPKQTQVLGRSTDEQLQSQNSVLANDLLLKFFLLISLGAEIIIRKTRDKNPLEFVR
jgi:hypothetical protein